MSDTVAISSILPQSKQPITGRKKMVLLIDDEKVTRFYARQVLEDVGYDVLEASHGAEAMAILQRQHIDAILLDISMLGMNGFETCRNIRQCINDPFLPVVMVTGLNDFDSIENAFQMGATDFTVKPVNWPILKKRLRYLMRTRDLSHELKLSEQGRRDLIDAIPDTLLRISADGRLLELKPGDHGAAPVVSLFSDINLYGKLPHEISAGFHANISRVLGGEGSRPFEFTLSQQAYNFYYEVRMFASGEHEVVAMVRDITTRHRDEQQIRHIAYNDAVTGLPNLAYVHQQLQTILRRCSTDDSMVALVRMEIVGLEHINSVLGTQSGDGLLRLLASRFGSSANNLCDGVCDLHEPLVGRVNGPGFVLVLEGIEDDDALHEYVAVLQKKMAETFLIGEYEMNIIARYGAFIGPVDGQDGHELMKKAELALAVARKGGSLGLNLYSSDTHTRTLGNVAMAHDLRHAIESGELHLEYQPKVDASSRKLVGVEALIRWHDAERGRVMPNDFIPLAEESDLILVLGEFVIYEACRQSSEWRNAGLVSVPIAINLSGHQFNQRGLVDSVRNAMSLYSIERGMLEVELTESVAIDNSSQVKKILTEFREHGIKTAIDDFGTGYSSLSSLQNFPFNTLKIDRSFVQHVASDSNAASITEAIINMGHVLGLNIVAEGVETAQQYAFPKDKGCDVIQGYFTGRPMTSAALQDHHLLQSIM
jgi:diguanylate cyclase (GGDEF)-like protein